MDSKQLEIKNMVVINNGNFKYPEYVEIQFEDGTSKKYVPNELLEKARENK